MAKNKRRLLSWTGYSVVQIFFGCLPIFKSPLPARLSGKSLNQI